MSPNGIYSGFDKILIISSSDSSDSESLLKEDVKSGENEINKQWEAIERTLYQEPGQHVTDTDLLKECKLWRETFPHFRVKGTKIGIKPTCTEQGETDKSLQTLKNHSNLKTLEEKRESMKTKVVGMLVERLIAKFRSDRESANSGVNFKSGVKITEINDEFPEKFANPSPKNNLIKSVYRNAETSTVVSNDNECYFERGKLPNGDAVSLENTSEIFHSWERNEKTAKHLPKTYQKNDFETFENQRNHSVMKYSEKSLKERFKPNKFTPPNSLGDVSKALEMTRKIDKKYEGLVDRIFERRSNELETIRHCPTSASELEMKSLQESLQKLRIGSGFNEFIKKNTNVRLNKFDNNWLRRREMYDSYTENKFPGKKLQNMEKTRNIFGEACQVEIDDKLLEDLKSEMALGYKRPLKGSGVIEAINLRRPKPFKPALEEPPKSFSCGDLQKKNKETKGRQPKSGLETGKSEPNLKKTVRYNRPSNNKGSRSTGNQNPLFPPIESGIICTELMGRPKVGPRVPAKRF